MIVKVQLSLVTTEVERQVLVYNRTRSYEAQLPMSACPGLEAEMVNIHRAFFKAKIVDGRLHLLNRVMEQDW